MGMMKNQMFFMVSQGLPYWVSHLFSGFLVAKTPFPLTFQFKSMMQREDTLVYFERLFDAYYLGPENRSANYYFEPEGVNIETRTYQAVYNDFLSKPPAGKKLVFAKEMAYYAVPANISQQRDFKWLPDLDCFQHTFLLRKPHTQVPSMVKVTLDEAELLRKVVEDSGTDVIDRPVPTELDLDEIGVQQLNFLFQFVTNRTGKTPVVVDVDDLWREPEKILKAYCERIGVEFDAAMLKWDQGWREEFRFWDNTTEWMRDVLKSTGFLKQGSTQRRGKNHGNTLELHPGAMQAMEAAEPLYGEMFSARITV